MVQRTSEGGNQSCWAGVQRVSHGEQPKLLALLRMRGRGAREGIRGTPVAEPTPCSSGSLAFLDSFHLTQDGPPDSLKNRQGSRLQGRRQRSLCFSDNHRGIRGVLSIPLGSRGIKNMESIALRIWKGSDGEATKRFYAQLNQCGVLGEIAVALFRVNKCSVRAKVYRGGIRGKGSYKQMAYDKKNWSISEVCKTLQKYSAGIQITWGWREDKAQAFHKWVIYVDLPTGQVSFHSETRGDGPDYRQEWDGQRLSAERICQFCDAVLTGDMPTVKRMEPLTNPRLIKTRIYEQPEFDLAMDKDRS